MVPHPPSSSSPPARYDGWRIALLSVAPEVIATFSELLLERGHEVVAVITPAGPDGPRPTTPLAWSVMQRVMQEAPPTSDILIAGRRSQLTPLIQAVKPDLLLTFFFPWRVPPEALAVPSLGAVNVHPALLPRYRGPNPLGWTLRNEEPEVGLTFHRMEPQFDTGPILAQGSLPYSDEDTVDNIVEKLMGLSRRLLSETLGRVAWGEPGEPQVEADATLAGHFDEAYRELDWSMPARSVHRRVRACRMATWKDGIPYVALATLEGQRLQVLQTTLAAEDPLQTQAAPGTVLRREGVSLLVQCGDMPLWITQSEPWRG